LISVERKYNKKQRTSVNVLIMLALTCCGFELANQWLCNFYESTLTGPHLAHEAFWKFIHQFLKVLGQQVLMFLFNERTDGKKW